MIPPEDQASRAISRDFELIKIRGILQHAERPPFDAPHAPPIPRNRPLVIEIRRAMQRQLSRLSRIGLVEHQSLGGSPSPQPLLRFEHPVEMRPAFPIMEQHHITQGAMAAGQQDIEHGHSLGGMHGDLAPVRAGNFAHDKQSQPEAGVIDVA